jgi:virginiamycin B lyase
MNRHARPALRGAALALLLTTLGAGAVGSAAAATTEFALSGFAGPESITRGPDGNLWFTEGGGNRIGRITPAGVISLFRTDPAAGRPHGITTGPDRNLWFTERTGNVVGRITPAGVITRFPLPVAGSGPTGITAGPDGSLWFTEQAGNRIGRITPGGALTEFAIPTADSQPASIATGPDGNLWFTEAAGNAIGRITPAGVITEFPLPLPLPTFNPALRSEPVAIAAGPDGNLWFTEANGGAIGRISVRGAIAEFRLPNPNSRPLGITVGPDGNLWFTEENGSAVGFITTAGAVTELAIPTARGGSRGITTGPDGNLWFAETAVNAVARLSPPVAGFRTASPITGAVQALALAALGRGLAPADQGAFEGLLGADCGPAGFDVVARVFFGSAEFQTARSLTLPATVSALYQSLLGRLPDAGGAVAWSAVLRAHRLAVAAGFIGSDEFQRLLPDPRDRRAVAGVVTRLYAAILDREPDPAGLAGWTDYIAATGDLDGAAAAFLASAEFEARPLSLQDYVALLYPAFLSRPPEPTGLAAWTALLGAALLDVIHEGFGASPEFRARVHAICTG